MNVNTFDVPGPDMTHHDGVTMVFDPDNSDAWVTSDTTAMVYP